MLGQTMSDQTMIRENSSSDKFSSNDSRRDVFEPGPSKTCAPSIPETGSRCRNVAGVCDLGLVRSAPRELIDDSTPSRYDAEETRLWKLSMGRGVSVLRNSLCWLMIVLSPLSLFATDTSSAILRSDGGVWVNGVEIAGSTALYPGDSLETKSGFVANIDAEGSSILIQSESVVKFEGTYLTLEHGSVSVGTSTSMSVQVNCLRVDPVAAERTQYDVIDLSGTVQVAAHKNDVNITQSSPLHKPTPESSSARSATVHEGQKTTRDESTVCGVPPHLGAASRGLNTKWLEIGGGAGVGTLALCLLLCRGSNPANVSPSQP